MENQSGLDASEVGLKLRTNNNRSEMRLNSKMRFLFFAARRTTAALVLCIYSTQRDPGDRRDERRTAAMYRRGFAPALAKDQVVFHPGIAHSHHLRVSCSAAHRKVHPGGSISLFVRFFATAAVCCMFVWKKDQISKQK